MNELQFPVVQTVQWCWRWCQRCARWVLVAVLCVGTATGFFERPEFFFRGGVEPPRPYPSVVAYDLPHGLTHNHTEAETEPVRPGITATASGTLWVSPSGAF